MSNDAFRYDDTCPDCDSFDLMFSNIREDDDEVHFMVQCRECDSFWEDFVVLDNQ